MKNGIENVSLEYNFRNLNTNKKVFLKKQHKEIYLIVTIEIHIELTRDLNN